MAGVLTALFRQLGLSVYAPAPRGDDRVGFETSDDLAP
jgi:hypothetical protein